MTLEAGSWVISWDGREWSEDDLTGSHAAILALMSGKDTWAQLNPFEGPMVLLQIIAVLVGVADQRDPVEVAGELGAVSLKRLLAAVSVVE